MLLLRPVRFMKGILKQLTLSLGDQRGKLGFLVGRLPPSEGFRRAIYLPYQRYKAVILTLTDADLIEMVNLKTMGEDPAEIIIRIYEVFLRPFAGA